MSSFNPVPGAFPSTIDDSDNNVIVSTPQSLSAAVKARKSEYTRETKIRVKVGSWNVAAIAGTEKDIGSWFIEGKGVSQSVTLGAGSIKYGQGPEGWVRKESDRGGVESVEDQEARRSKKATTVPLGDDTFPPEAEKVDLYALGLQEIVDVASVTEAVRPFADPNQAKRWRVAVEEALPKGFELIAEQQMTGLLLLVYASPSLAPSISSVSTTSVGTGVWGYMGNKGAVSARLFLGETTRLIFVNSHLAAGSDKASLHRRNWDTAQILSRTRFDPVKDGQGVNEQFGDAIGDEDYGFWFGDLNYRLDDIPGDDVRRLLLLHTRNEYDISNESKRKIDEELGPALAAADSSKDLPPLPDPGRPRSSTEDSITLLDNEIDPKDDPTSLHTTLTSLLSHDQLRAQMRQRKAFHDGWREGPLTFLPTYKYDVGSVGMFDSSEKKRGPSWCDRILYRSKQDRAAALQKLAEEAEARKKDEDMKARGLDESEDVLFDYDPDADGDDGGDYDEQEPYDEVMDSVTQGETAGDDDKIHLEYYMSHQRVLSSDHKPLEAIFTVVYDAVVPELKAKIHQDVARELDKAENEGRPGITVVVDQPYEAPRTSKADGSSDMNGVDFGQVRYGFPVARHLTIANTGRVPASFGFHDRPVHSDEDKGIAPKWIKVIVDWDSDNPGALYPEYTLMPGDTVNIELTLRVYDIHQVTSLNNGKAMLDDILVLGVNQGRDHFIPLHGEWLQSCFGRPLAELTQLPEGGVRQLGTHHVESRNDGVRLSAPRELFRLTEAITDLIERSLAEWEMTATASDSVPPWRSDKGPGWPFAAQTWSLKDHEKRDELLGVAREALDTAASMTTCFDADIPAINRLEVLSETLIQFLYSLTDGIVTRDLWSQIEPELLAREKSRRLYSNEEMQAWLLELMSSAPAHSVAFTFLTFMLSRVAAEIAPAVQDSSAIETQAPIPEPHAHALSEDTNAAHLSTQSPAKLSYQASGSGATTPLTLLTKGTGSLRRLGARASIIPDRNGTSHTSPTQSSPSTSTPAATTATKEADPLAATRRAIEEAYIAIFADAMIRTIGSGPTREKDRKLWNERKRSILRFFLEA